MPYLLSAIYTKQWMEVWIGSIYYRVFFFVANVYITELANGPNFCLYITGLFREK